MFIIMVNRFRKNCGLKRVGKEGGGGGTLRVGVLNRMNMVHLVCCM